MRRLESVPGEEVRWKDVVEAVPDAAAEFEAVMKAEGVDPVRLAKWLDDSERLDDGAASRLLEAWDLFCERFHEATGLEELEAALLDRAQAGRQTLLLMMLDPPRPSATPANQE